MSDKAIIEAAARALESLDEDSCGLDDCADWYQDKLRQQATAVLAAVTPLLRSQVLEEAAARLLELAREERNLDGATLSRAAEYLDALRALIPPTPPPFADSA